MKGLSHLMYSINQNGFPLGQDGKDAFTMFIYRTHDKVDGEW
jgi:hypothetical protein